MAASPVRTTTRYSAARTMFWVVTTRTPATTIRSATTAKATFSATMGGGLLLGGLGPDLEGGRLGHGLHPLAEPVLVVEEDANPHFGILVLGAPEQGVERADLDTDAAVHAQGVVDVE